MTPRLLILVVALGITQIVSWGPLYYSMAVLWPRVSEDLELSRTMVMGIVSLALLLNGVVAPRVGAAIDRYGGRLMMSIGSLIAGAGLAVVALAPNVWVYALGWSMGGVAMSMVLYDPAFATLSQHSGENYRRALTAVTLLGGLASTVFWPLTGLLLDTVDWRGAFWIFAALQVVVCLPLHAFAIPARPPERAPLSGKAGAQGTTADGALTTQPRSVAERETVFRWLAVSFALHAFLMSAVAVNLLTLLQARGLSLADAVLVGAVMGPMQVAGRFADMLTGGRLPGRVIGIGALSVVTLAMAFLGQTTLSLAMAMFIVGLYGSGNGLITIAKGMNVADIFGREHYGYWLGRLARWVYIMYAVAPLSFGLALGFGLDDLSASWLFFLFGVGALACYVRATR